VKGVPLADLFQAMLEGIDKQSVLGSRMGGEHGLEQERQAADLGHSFERGRVRFEVIEETVKNLVLGQQCFGNFHHGIESRC